MTHCLLLLGVQRTPRQAPAAVPLALKMTFGAMGIVGGSVGGPAPWSHDMSKLTSPMRIEDLILTVSSSILHAGALPSWMASSAWASMSAMSG